MTKKIKTQMVMAVMAVVLGSMMFASCNKENETLLPTGGGIESKDMIKSIPHFASMDAFQKEVAATLDIDTTPYRIEQENARGWLSIGLLSDMAYENLGKEKFENEKESLEFYNQHKEYFDTMSVNGELAIVPKLFNSPYRYVANSLGLFSVDTLYYKLFKDCIVATTKENLYDLIKMSDEDLYKADTTRFFYANSTSQTSVEHKNCQHSWSYLSALQSDEDMVVVELITFAPYRQPFGYFAETRLHTFSLHKWSGIWWTARHTLTCEGTVKWHVKDADGTWLTKENSVYKKRGSNSLWVGVNSEPLYWGASTDYYHYYAYSIKARTPGLAYATLNH